MSSNSTWQDAVSETRANHARKYREADGENQGKKGTKLNFTINLATKGKSKVISRMEIK
jgi:hypothetical protein